MPKVSEAQLLDERLQVFFMTAPGPNYAKKMRIPESAILHLKAMGIACAITQLLSLYHEVPSKAYRGSSPGCKATSDKNTSTHEQYCATMSLALPDSSRGPSSDRKHMLEEEELKKIVMAMMQKRQRNCHHQHQ